VLNSLLPAVASVPSEFTGVVLWVKSPSPNSLVVESELLTCKD
jgi:hypothetical protein